MVKTSSLDALTSGKKSAQLKREILRRYTQNGGESIADLSRELGLSVPTLTKTVSELIEEDVFVALDYDTAVARRNVPGGTGPLSVARQLENIKHWLGDKD